MRDRPLDLAGGSARDPTELRPDYRMYDYGRPRELHIEKSLEAHAWLRAPQVSPKSLRTERSHRRVLLLRGTNSVTPAGLARRSRCG